MVFELRVLVTGGAGFIGSNLVRYFGKSSDDFDVRVLDDLSTGKLENLAGSDVEFILGSILDAALLRKAVAGVDVIVHLAALGSVPRSVLDPQATHDANATGTLNVLEAARTEGIDYVIVASSSSVYGSNLALPKSETDWTRPMSPYAVSKLATESYALAYGSSYGIKTLAFRFFNVYGPYQSAGHVYAAVIPRFLEAGLSGRPLQIHGDGLQSRDFTFVDTVCAVLEESVRGRVQSPGPVNLAYGSQITLLELVGSIEKILKRKLELEFLPARTGDVRSSQADGLRVRELFPQVLPVSLDAGLAQTVTWFSEQSV